MTVTNALFIAQQAGAGGCISAMALPVVMIVLLYFLLIRPQQKQMKEQEEFQDSLKVGDQVVTAGGIYGEISSIDEDIVKLEVSSRTKIRMVRSQIVQSSASVKDDGQDEEDNQSD